MSTIARPSQPAVAPPSEAPEGRAGLAGGALGLPSVLFCIVTGAAPLAAMMFNVPVAVLGGGYAVPAAFLLATIALTVFSVGYIEMAGRVTAAGGFYTFITRGLGRVAGLGSAFLIALCYVVFSAAVMGVFGYFASTTFNDWFGVDIPGWIYSFVCLGVVSAFAFFHIELTAKVLGVALVCEVVALIILSVGVIGHGGGPDGFSASPLNPAKIFDNSTAVSVFGAGAAGVALFGAFWSWVGFEMAPNYAEESREPKKIAKAATYGSVIGLGVFYTFMSWIFVTGFGLKGVGTGVNDQFEGKVASAWYTLTDEYVGSVLTTGFQLFIITSSFACAMAFYNTAARYLFSLSREKMLPAALGRTHRTKHSPVNASLAVTAMMVIYIGAFTIDDSSTEASLLKIGTWSPLLGVLGILAVQALASVAIIAYFMTKARDGMHWWKTILAPIIGCVAMLGACYLLVDNRPVLAGNGSVPFVQAIPWIVVGIFVIGVVTALVVRATSAERFAGIGSFEHDDALVHQNVRIAGGPEPAAGL
jgi:amino acid transporter